ncbi:MAG: hypothetical protein M1817_001051 [Caeruleum heppii]|nr:MAG: hypothetical protein M1817_001051 [Caeruleum heppii]
MELDYSGTSSDYPSGLPPDEQGSSEILENNVQSALLPTNYPEVGLYGGLQDTSADLVYDVPMARHRVRSAAAAWSPVAPTTPPTNQMTVTYASPWDLTTDFLTPATDMRSENVEQFRQFAGSECRSDASMVSRVALAQSEHSNGSLGSPHQRGNTASTGATASYRRLRPRAQPRPRTPEQYSDEESGDLFCSSDEEVGSLIHERKRKRVTKCNSSDSEGETSARKRKCKISGNKQERVLPKLDPNAPRIRINQTTRGINKSSANREADAERKALYDTLPQTPEPWSIFNYERSGDLCRADTYSAKELLTYFYRHPLHSHDNVLDLKQSRLRLRLQVQPAEKSRRDPAGTGRLCRFAKCPTPNNIIHPGDFRIAFDEQGWRGAEENHCHDPYLNAGVVHLDCMERFVDLPGLIRDLNFKVETRDLPLEIGGRNTMSLDKRGWTKRIAPAARAFVKACEKDEVPGDYPRITDYSSDAQRPHAGRLTHRLVKKKIDAEPPGKGKIRIERGDRPTQLHNHMGDEKFRWQEKAKIRRQRRAIREGVREYNSEESEGELARERAAKRERRKRKYLEQDEEENGGEDEEEQYDKFDEAPGRVRMLQYREVDSRPIKKRKF